MGDDFLVNEEENLQQYLTLILMNFLKSGFNKLGNIGGEAIKTIANKAGDAKKNISEKLESGKNELIKA